MAPVPPDPIDPPAPVPPDPIAQSDRPDRQIVKDKLDWGGLSRRFQIKSKVTLWVFVSALLVLGAIALLSGLLTGGLAAAS